MQETKKINGRPPIYRDEFSVQAGKLALLGMKDTELAQYFGVTVECIDKWKQNHPNFLQAIKENREISDIDVVVSLRKRALGYTASDGKDIPPDTTAAIFWLKNRQGKYWREKQEIATVEKIESEDVDIDSMSANELKTYMDFLKKHKKIDRSK